MDLIILPFHDWRKSEAEGFRTRDVHFIKAFEKLDSIKKVLVINRPFTRLELFLKKYKYQLKGEIVLQKSNFTLTKVSNKVYVADFQSYDIFGQVFKRHKWFINKYDDDQYKKFIGIAKEFLGIDECKLVCQNVFAYKLSESLNESSSIFDAWDNFIKFPAYKYLRDNLMLAYSSLSFTADYWLTNSVENIDFYKKHFNVKEVRLITNGVNQDFLVKNDDVPIDIIGIPRPIIGFGGKISYLLDVELINFITEDNPLRSFVFVGQILDRGIFRKIIKRHNVFFLGDKNYSIYPQYVNAFDIAIIPYHINERQHGGDSIKAYEYLIAGKKVVGTRGNGLVRLDRYINLIDNKYEFSKQLSSTVNNKEKFSIDEHTWEKKSIDALSDV